MAIGMSLFILHEVLWFYWLDHNPSTPRIETGQIYPLNNHGYYFYVTKSQKLFDDSGFFTFVVFCFGGVILGRQWKVIRDPGDNLPRKL